MVGSFETLVAAESALVRLKDDEMVRLPVSSYLIIFVGV